MCIASWQKSINIDAFLPTGFPQALEIMENLENHKKVPCLEKSWNLKKTE